MGLPKRRHSRSRSGKRRAQQGLVLPSLSTCPQCQEPKLPHRVCPHCGTYKGRTLIEVTE
jgi:large subunit ribosomal protein L32